MSETFTRKQLQAAVAKRLEDFEFAGQVLLDRQREHITALEKENAELLADCKRKDELLTAAVDDYNDVIAALEPFAREADRWNTIFGDAYVPNLTPSVSEPGDRELAAFTVGDLRRASLASSGRTEV